MAVTRRAASTIFCNNCRFSVLRSFASLSGTHLNRPEFALRRAQSPTAFTIGCRSITTSQTLPQHRREAEKDGLTNEEILEEAEQRTQESQSASPLPWYLQVSESGPAQSTSSPISAKQEIPELPSHPPPILSDILEHVSVTLGLDDLILYDLRDVDPPPALGANLIMIIGSARSEKHLHVSADRFCRWLRSNYKLSPRPDGLLGRNELKLKLRRKAKRSRLMSNVGASETANSDDGIRTGWICVAVGEVEAAKSAPKEEFNKEFVGFRDEATGVNIVVQMLTEERREEVGLERLWEGILRRTEKEQAAIKTGQDIPNEELSQPEGVTATS